jgi:hypothetical protein
VCSTLVAPNDDVRLASLAAATAGEFSILDRRAMIVRGR